MDQVDVLREITDARIESFLGSADSQVDLGVSEGRNSLAISTILDGIKADLPEVFGGLSDVLAAEDMELLNVLVGNKRKLNPEEDWVEELPFFLTKIKNKETVF